MYPDRNAVAFCCNCDGRDRKHRAPAHLLLRQILLGPQESRPGRDRKQHAYEHAGRIRGYIVRIATPLANEELGELQSQSRVVRLPGCMPQPRQVEARMPVRTPWRRTR